MASVKEYAYYWEGNKIAIVERDTAFDNDVNSKDYGPGSDRSQWKSPKTSVTSGIEVQFTYNPLPENGIDESYKIPLQPYLNKALVYYIKAKYLEEAGELEKREYFMGKFYKQIEKYNNSKVAGIRIVAPGPLAIR